jgi:uncharacterized membrane protein
LPMLELLPPLNDKNLPWLDVIHPIVVHFVIAMALITVVFDVIGVVSRKKNLFEVSFWNLIVATVAIFVAIIFGQVEAGLANPYGASRDTSMHSQCPIVQVQLYLRHRLQKHGKRCISSPASLRRGHQPQQEAQG